MAPIGSSTVRLAGLVLAAGLSVAACGGESGLATACGDVVTETLDPTWSVHLLPNAPEPDYLTDPPTSGAHYAADPATGIVPAPLDAPSQLTVLELGGVLMQYRPDALDAADRGRLERLAGGDVVVAPAPDLPDPVIATAWTTKQRCEGVALGPLTAFIDAHGGRGPAADG